MSTYILRQNSREKLLINSNSIFNINDLFLIYYYDISKLSGIYKINKIYKNEGSSDFSYNKITKFRRSLDINDLYYNKIKFNFHDLSYKLINKVIFRKLVEQLEIKNYQQSVTDYLFFQIKNNFIEIDYIQNHPDILHIKKYINYNPKHLKNLNLLLKDTLNKIVNFYNINDELSAIEQRLINTFFQELTVFNKITGRFISIKTDSMLSSIPFEIFLFNKKRNFFISRILDIDEIKTKCKMHFSSSIKFIYPEYKKNSLANQNEIKALKRNLKNIPYEILCKSFKPAEFIKLLENSYIFHFSGHSVYNVKRKEYGLKINDNKIFYFSDFAQCLNLPDMITFNSCFDFKHIRDIQESLKILFQSGCKNIILPFTEIWQKQPVFFPEIFKCLQNGMEIGKAFRYVINSLSDDLKFYPMLFRLYGNPMEKYFKKK